ANNRLIFTGGGHHDYWGNEVYALDLNSLTIKRLSQASQVPGDASTTNYEALPDGAPSARHTYGGINFTPTTGELWLQGGGIAGIGALGHETYRAPVATFTTNTSGGASGTNTWVHPSPTMSGGSFNNQFGNILEYDSASDHLWLWEAWQSLSGQLWEMTS